MKVSAIPSKAYPWAVVLQPGTDNEHVFAAFETFFEAFDLVNDFEQNALRAEVMLLTCGDVLTSFK